MATINRTIPPEFKQVQNINIIEASERELDNGIPLYFINKGTQDLVKIELLFKAGCWYEPKRLVSNAVNTMLNEGTQFHTAAEIADGMDFYGAFFQTENGSDWASVTLYTLNKYLEQTLPLLKEIVTLSNFPKKEFETYIQNKKLHLMVDNERGDYIARKKFDELIFGSHHPYGYYVSERDYDDVSQEDLITYHKQFYTSDNCRIVASGKVTDEVIHFLNKFLGTKDWAADEKIEKSFLHKTKSVNQREQLVLKEDSIQSGIRIGKILFNKLHPDYFGMQLLNTVLGGYFGSRLMANIREDKGYTYGIGSAIVSCGNEGYFYITTEIGVDVCQKALDEIYFELNRLRTELIPEEELQLVKNYILGTFLRSIDGPFELANKLKGILMFDLGYDYYHSFINTVKVITSETLRELANKYLGEETMIELVVGKK